VAARDASFVENNGVIDAGTNPEMANFFQNGAASVAFGYQTAVFADGASVVNNNNTGVINVAARGNYRGNTGVLLSSSATLNNYGAINIAASNEASSVLGEGSNIGVVTQQSTTFNNEGTLYIGRMAQRVPSDSTVELAIKQSSIGVQLNDNGTYNGTNSSKIIIGTSVQNATAIDVRGPATLKQQGTIQLNGAMSGQSVSSNTGILVRAGTDVNNVINSGTIDVNGLNSTGVKVLANGQITNSGTINVNGGLDPVTHYANYGIYAQGEKALAVLSGQVNLTGNGAIGVHARDKGEIDVTQNGSVTFNGGTKQTGYYIFGPGSKIKNDASSVQDVSTQDSTLYRVDGGASFNGSDNSAAQLNALGDNATIVRTTGSGSQFSSGKLVLSVTGEGATGVRIEGGATGEITADAVIVKVAGKDTTAGIVDGNYYELDGTENAAKKGNSILTSYGTLETANTANGAFGYIARNDGELVHKGSIDFTKANSTGVLVDGGILDNRTTISVNGVAVNIQGASSEVTNTGTITATDGTAAYLLGADATLALNGNGITHAEGSAHGILLDTGAKGLTVDGATITMSATGSGSAIENKADIVGIQLKDTTLNVGNGIGVHTGATMAQTNSGTINVTGSGTGILFENIDGSQTNKTLDMSDSKDLVINVQQTGGKGIVANASSDLKTNVSVNVLDSAGGSALIVKGSTQKVEQSGKLTSNSTTDAVVDINNGKVSEVVNRGDILALNASQKAVETTSGSGVQFTNAKGGNIIGQVNLLTGNNVVTLESGSTGTDFTTGNGSDLFLLKDVKESETSLFTSLIGGQGDDTLKLDNSHYVSNRVDAINGMEHIDLTNGSIFTLDSVLLALGDSRDDSAATGYSIDSTSTLAIKNNASVAFNSHLSGSGLMTVDTASNQFEFTSNNAADGFVGTVAMGNTRFDLDGLNTQALTNATLRADNDSITHVVAGQQTIGGLAFNGGTVKFDGVTPGLTVAAGTIHTTDNMDLLGKGFVQVDAGSVSNDRPLPNTHVSLLEQDDTGNLIKLADSDATVQGSGGNLELHDASGNVISDGVTLDIIQSGTTVAKGTYDYRLTGGSNADGLYINYGLKEVELLGQHDNALVLNSYGKRGAASDLSAKVTGIGDLHIDTGVGMVSLSNLNNDYSGETKVNSGTLELANDGVLGKTSNLQIAYKSTVDMQGHSQKVGALNTAVGSQILLSAGSELMITDSQRAAGITDGGTINTETLRGMGRLIIDPSVINVKGSNTGFTGDVSVEGGSQVLLNNVSGLGDSGTLTLKAVNDRLTFGKQDVNDAAVTGKLSKQLAGSGQVELNDNADITLAADNSAFSGDFVVESGSQLHASSPQHLGGSNVSNNGVLHLTANSGWQLTNNITGTGDVEKLGAGDLIVDRELTYSGTTSVQEGRWVLGSNASASGKISGNGAVNIASGTTLGGNGVVTGSVDNKGTLASLNALNGYENQAISTLMTGGLTNSGMIDLAGTKAGNTLVVNGNYAGNNGLLSLNTVLGDDNSVTDKMVVNGDTSGNTRVQVNNMGGNGAQTNKGIEVVQVDGKSDGAFTLQGRAVAGAYDYFLNKGEADGNWYLKSQLPTQTPGPDNKPSPGDTAEPGKSTDMVVRPEVGAYSANIAASNTLFITTMHDRLGETNYVDALTGEQKVTSMWMRNVGGHSRFSDNSGQLKTQSNRYVLQFGGDIASWGQEGSNRTHLGLMAGYGNHSSNTRSSITKYSADGSVNGYSVGVYGTWFANEAEHTGAYVDTWGQYSWFNNSVKGEELASESYKSDGFTASMETGYTFKTGEFKGSKGTLNSVYVQPQAQAIWMGVKGDPHTEANGTRVETEGDGNVMTRLGVRTFLKSHHQMDSSKGREFEPFIEANWIHNTKNFGSEMNGVSSSIAGAKNIAELKVGVEGKINNNLNIWGSIGNQLGDKSYSDASATIGVKYSFK
jgi:autotransporter family porin